MSGGHWHCLPNRRTVYGPDVEILASVNNHIFLCCQAILNYELKIVHNSLEQAVVSLITIINTSINSFCFSKSFLFGCNVFNFSDFSPMTPVSPDLHLNQSGFLNQIKISQIQSGFKPRFTV